MTKTEIEMTTARVIFSFTFKDFFLNMQQIIRNPPAMEENMSDTHMFSLKVRQEASIHFLIKEADDSDTLM